MYFFKGLGIEIEPSLFWLFSSIPIINLPTAKPEPFKVPIKSDQLGPQCVIIQSLQDCLDNIIMLI